ncbi:MAG: DUF2203 domain-containing protein [Candidatus Sericytochromatia bacterium]|nr:DUF2203 domain-containing protein [Candidatus Sericytochromatia bacterium]
MTVFSLAEANALIPELRRLISRAQAELGSAYDELKSANDALLNQEWQLRQARIDGITGDTDTETLQRQWQIAADHLTGEKETFGDLRETWVHAIHDRGVLLRDLQRGLVDFPALLGEAEFFYCWVVNEDEITHWHSRKEGFTNRKPLDALHSWDGEPASEESTED